MWGDVVSDHPSFWSLNVLISFISFRGEYIMDAVTGMRLSIKIPVFYLTPKTALNSPHSVKFTK